ncbi:MAG: alanine racemase, partial [Candidatus Eremiobacteraeota bacterium]|nr:alanine racemase [Candidatus Eremiobacteraeota bacterium]
MMLETESRQLRWRGDLAPGHVRGDGALVIGGVRVGEIAQAYGTPALILDGGVLEAAIAEFTEAAKPHGIEVAYAAKALLLIGLARTIETTPLRIDVCSLGELVTAERAGFSASRLSLHGCGKTSQELAAAARGRVARTIVDNLDELAELGRIASAASPVPILLRINTGIEAHTHAFVQTGGDDTKFGIAAHDFAAAAEILQNNSSMIFLGLHSHIGSQIYEAAAFVANVHKLMEVAAQFTAWSLPVAELIVGGGFGIETGPQQTEHLDIPGTIAAIASAASEHANRLHVSLPKIGLEPGRAIVG